MTDAERVILAVRELTHAMDRFADRLAGNPEGLHTAPREQPAQDVSDELLERLISASAAAVNTSRTKAEEIRLDRVVQEAKAIQHARAAKREG